MSWRWCDGERRPRGEMLGLSRDWAVFCTFLCSSAFGDARCAFVFFFLVLLCGMAIKNKFMILFFCFFFFWLCRESHLARWVIVVLIGRSHKP